MHTERAVGFRTVRPFGESTHALNCSFEQLEYAGLDALE